MEPMTGIEPAYSAWEADVLPLNYIGVRTRGPATAMLAKDLSSASQQVATCGAFRSASRPRRR